MKPGSPETNKPTKEINQNYVRYNRESGKKTLFFIGIIILIVVILSILLLFLISKPKTLTSSIQNQPQPTAELPQN